MTVIRAGVVTAALCAAPFLASFVPASAQGVNPLVSSAAFGIQAGFTGGGMSTSLGPVAPVAGSAPPAYARTKVVTSYSGSVAIPPLVPGAVIYPIVASLDVTAAMLTSHVASGGIGINDVSATGSSSVNSVALRIANPQPVPPTPPVSPPYLTVVASGVQASASYAKVFPSAVSVFGSASFGSLAISGTLLAGTTVSYSGTAPANTVLYQSSTITITVHQQIIAALVACPPCVATPASITVHALDIALNNAVIDGRTVSGDIVVGDASAQ